MTIYLDNDYRCHVSNDGSMRAYETDFFEGKCRAYIECFRLVPAGEIWVRKDGTLFGPQETMIAPWKEGYLEAQAAYEQARAEFLVPAEAAYQEGVNSI